MKITHSLRNAVYASIRRSSPFLGDCLAGWHMYKHTKRSHSEEQNRFARTFYGQKSPTVLGGSFRGMIYENRTYFGPVTPRWIGSYEKELYPVIDSIHNFDPECIVDIGAAEGYYSVGLARMFPSVKVFSYETNPLSIFQQRRLMRLNNVTNLHIGRYCTQEALCKHGKSRCFILSDIEGCELDLFSLDVASCLNRALLLIELHQFGDLDAAAVGNILSQRFEGTHTVKLITPRVRTVEDIEINLPPGFTGDMLVTAMDEYRSQPQMWMYCTPKEAT